MYTNLKSVLTFYDSFCYNAGSCSGGRQEGFSWTTFFVVCVFGEKQHTPLVDTGDRKVTRTRMKDGNGFYVDLSKVETIPRDMTAIRMNVDNFHEAYEILTAHGFRKAPGIEEVNLETAKALLIQIYFQPYQITIQNYYKTIAIQMELCIMKKQYVNPFLRAVAFQRPGKGAFCRD